MPQVEAHASGVNVDLALPVGRYRIDGQHIYEAGKGKERWMKIGTVSNDFNSVRMGSMLFLPLAGVSAMQRAVEWMGREV